MATKTIDPLADAENSRRKPKAGPNPVANPQVCLRYLTPDEYPAWDQFVEESPQGSAFSRTWWIQAVGARVLGLFRSGQLVAGIPLYYEKRMGMRVCTLPKLTQTFGLIMEPPSGKRVNAAGREMETIRIFADHLAKEKVFYQSFHPSLTNWLPFKWKGFQQTSSFTYVLDDLTDLDAIWQGMETQLRNVVRKAQKLGITVGPCKADTVYELSCKTFSRQGLPVPYRREYLERLIEAALLNDAGACLAAADPAGRVHAAGLLIWDSKRTYYLVAGGDPDVRSSGAQSLLAWHSIQLASTRSTVFDFEGSALEGVERVFRSFGARQLSYNRIMKFPLWMHTYLLVTGKI